MMRRHTAAAKVCAITIALAFATTAFGTAGASASTPATRPAPAGASASVPSAVKADINELLKSYNASTGLIGGSWWQAAVALSTLETYQQTTGDSSVEFALIGAYRHQASGNFEDNWDDDTGWWALVWLQAYQITHDSAFLSIAETDANYIHKDWDSTCGGGVWWKRSPHYYKNAIANELFLELTAWLHNTIHGDKKYLAWAEAEWKWFDHSGLINKSYLINDGLAPKTPSPATHCTNNGQNTWTYNQGVILAGLAQLYKATGDKALLTEAKHIASAAISHLTVQGVLTEPHCKNGCGTDAESFKGVFVRDLKVLAETAKTTAYNSFFKKQAQSIEAKDTTSGHKLGMFWAGPISELTGWSQASALDALVAALKLP
jgi:hypothetical protein